MDWATALIAWAGQRGAGHFPGWLGPAIACLLAASALALLGRALRQARRQGAGPRQRVELDMFRGAHRDPLTGLPNRQSFSDVLSGRLLTGIPQALLLLDLDEFATLNSAYGHRAGDEVLVAASDRLRTLVPDYRQLGRLGGDEFAVLLDASQGPDVAEATALRLLRAMTAPLRVGMHTLACGVSVGVAVSPTHAVDADSLLAAAHSALDVVKAAGGGAWRFFDPERGRAEKARLALREELREAVGAGQIFPHYQPIVELATGAMVGLEVLARWAHPARGLLHAEHFIPLAEEMQLAGQITQCLMRRLIADMRGWPPWLTYAFNVSPGQLRELISLIRTSPSWPEGTLDPARLEIEMTESALTDDFAVTREVVALLRARGTRVVLDDFGVGASNFVHLRELPFDRIKIDGSFVRDVIRDERAQACIRAMLALGQSLGAEMVAEGIEDMATAKFLADLGCRLGQGLCYAEAVPADEVGGLLRRLVATPARAAC